MMSPENEQWVNVILLKSNKGSLNTTRILVSNSPILFSIDLQILTWGDGFGKDIHPSLKIWSQWKKNQGISFPPKFHLNGKPLSTHRF